MAEATERQPEWLGEVMRRYLEELMRRYPDARDLILRVEEAHRRKQRGSRATLDIHDHPYLRSRRVSSAAPTSGQAYTWNDTLKQWEPTTVSGGGGAHGPSDHTEFAAWKLLYTDGSGDQQEIALGALGKILQSAGTAAAPTMSPPWVASATQTVVAGNPILANSEVVTIDAAGDVTMTAAPTIAAGQDGQILTIVNVDTVDDVTLQDAGVLSGSLLRLGASTRTLAAGGGSIDLVYSTDVGAWVEKTFNSLVTITPSIDSFTIDIGSGAYSAQNAEVANTGTHPSTFAMTYTGVPSAASIDVSAGGDPGSDWPTTVASPYTSHTGPAFNKGTAVSTVRTFTLSATVNGQAKQRTCTVTYINRRYVGPDNNGGQLTSAEILALDATAAGQSGLSNSKYGTFYNIDTTTGEYIYYCYRSALGTVSWFSIENEIAKFNSEGIMSHTNDSGFVENFQQYRSENTNLGANKDFRALSSQPNNRIYMGPAVNGTDVISNAELLALDDTADGESVVSNTVARTYTQIGISTGEYLWFCHPDRVADLATIKDASTGFGIAGSYRTNVTHTNQWGYQETYRCWRSDNPNIFPTGEDVIVT